MPIAIGFLCNAVVVAPRLKSNAKVKQGKKNNAR